MTHVRYRLGPPDKPINAQDSDAERKKRQKKKIYCEEFNAEKGPQKKKREKRMYKQSNDNDRDDVVALNYIDGLSGMISKNR